MPAPLAVLLVLAAAARQPFDELHKSLPRDARQAEARVRGFIVGAGGTPIMEGEEVVFLVEGDPANPPRVIGDFNAWGEGEEGAKASQLERLGVTRFFFRREPLRPDARVEYLILSGGKETPDPLNPRRVEGFSGPQSEVRMPGYTPVVRRPEDASVPRGEVIPFEHRSAILGNTRGVHVYLPPGYDKAGSRRYPEAWLGDGTSYVQAVGTPRLLDGLIAEGRLEPVVVILVDPADRRVEYDLNAGFRRMMVSELVPLIAKDYRVEGRPERRLVAGGSRGGQAALDLCLAAPEAFGLCAAWAPAIAPRGVEAFLAKRPARGLFVLIRALYDDRFGPDAPALRDGLASLGARTRYIEVAQGHTLAAWPDLTALALLEAYPGRP